MGCGSSKFGWTYYGAWKQTSTFIGGYDNVDFARIGKLLTPAKGDILSFTLMYENLRMYDKIVIWKENHNTISCVVRCCPFSIRTSQIEVSPDGTVECNIIIPYLCRDRKISDIVLNIGPDRTRLFRKETDRTSIACMFC